MNSREPQGGGSPFLTATNVLLRHRKLLVGMPIVAFVVAFGVAILMSDTGFRAESKLLPQDGQTQGGGLQQLASQLGLGGGPSLQSPALYLELLESRELLRAAVTSELRVPVRGGRETLEGTLIELLPTPELPTAEDSIRTAMGLLHDRMEVDLAPGSGLIELAVVAEHPELAEAINRRLIELLERFNRETRQSQVRAERVFVEGRVAEARAELMDAERRLQRFLDQNRRFEESAQLRFEHLRIQREVERLQALYTSLAQALEQARIEEVRNTPVFTVIDGPENSATTVRNLSVPVTGLFGLVVGFVLAIAIAFGRESLARQRAEHPEEFEEMRRLGRRAVTEAGLSRLRQWIPFLGRSRNGAPAADEVREAEETPRAREEALR